MKTLSHIREDIESSASNTSLTGSKWSVRIIATGESKNARIYPESVLRKAAPLLELTPVYAARGPDHDFFERGVRSLVGYIENPRYEGVNESDTNLTPGIYGDLIIVDESLKTTLVNLESTGNIDSFVGLSIVAYVDSEMDAATGIVTVTDIEKFESTDIVQRPAAGGKFLSITESERGNIMKETTTSNSTTETVVEETEKVVEPNKTEKVVESDTTATPSQEQIASVLKFLGISPASESVSTETTAILDEMKKINNSNRIHTQKDMVAKAKLNQLSTDQLNKLVESTEMTNDQLDILVNAEKDKEAALKKSVVENLSTAGKLIVTDNTDIKAARVQAIFAPNSKIEIGEGETKRTIHAYRNFTEAYCDWYEVSPVNINRVHLAEHMMRTFAFDMSNKAQQDKLVESLTTADLAEVMSQYMHKALVENYVNFPQYQDWRLVSTILPNIMDYQPHHRIKFGGYSDLTVVNEAGVYPVLSNPTDEETTFTMQKRGGIASQITREAILNDNVGAIRTIPRELALAANRTLYRNVFNLVASSSIVTSGNNNLVSGSGLTAARLDEAVRLMRSQTRYGTNDVLGQTNLPQYLVVPNELEGVGQRLVGTSSQVVTQLTNNTSDAFDAVRFRGAMQLIVVDDYSSATNWFTIASPSMHEGVIVAFLGGQETPELFVQNDPRQGEMFSMDAQNIKVRHEWVTGVTDHRPIAGYRS